jgi:hypothetical protein
MNKEDVYFSSLAKKGYYALQLSDYEALRHYIDNHEFIDERGLRAAEESELIRENPFAQRQDQE